MSHPVDKFTSTKNQLANANNKYQGDSKRVLCVCSAGMLRSPTAAVVLQSRYGYNTRAVGIEQEFALMPLTEVLLVWADEIVCFDLAHQMALETIIERIPDVKEDLYKNIHLLRIPDEYDYMEEELQGRIWKQYEDVTL